MRQISGLPDPVSYGATKDGDLGAREDGSSQEDDRAASPAEEIVDRIWSEVTDELLDPFCQALAFQDLLDAGGSRGSCF